MILLPRAALLLAATTTVLGTLLVGPGQGALAAPTPTPPPVAVAPPVASPLPSASPTISAADVQQALNRQQAALQQEKARLNDSTVAAAALLQASQTAQRAAQAAAATARVEARRLVQAREQTTRSRERLSSYAGSLYRTGMVDARMVVLAAAVAAPDVSSLASDLRLAQQVGKHQSDTLDAMRTAQQQQAAAAQRSSRAASASRAASLRAGVAKAAADRVVADLQRRVQERRKAVALTGMALVDAEHREAMLAAAERIAQQRSRPPEAALQGASVPRPAATCKGKSLEGYDNGRIPADALCLLWGTYQQMLRADAAAAFDAMSHEYALTFGAPLCVTDSYRSYAEQVSVKSVKPELAAVPGTSNHGWAVAVDLCDGIESFGTPTHTWMQANSMRFGWFHPDWAEPTGTKPEPWHWEFAG